MVDPSEVVARGLGARDLDEAAGVAGNREDGVGRVAGCDGLPITSNGVSVPRPTLTLVPSNKQMLG